MMLESEYMTAAPDVIERLRTLPEAQPGETLAKLYLHGLPIYQAWALPKGHWMRWKDGRPVDMGRLTDKEEGPAR